jgi:8-oxo-dGTP pyrophosphatase MutT (NUDIX family)
VSSLRTARLREELQIAAFPQCSEFLSLLAGPGDPYSRLHYDPGHITGSAFVAHPSQAAVALVHHDKLDMWVQPGGHVEPADPTVEEAARREVAEEIGLAGLDLIGLVDIDIHTFPARSDQPTHLHFDVRYGYRAHVAKMKPGDGVRQTRWIGADAALQMDESIARAVRAMAQLCGW